MNFLRTALILAALLAADPARADVVTRLPTQDRVIALTFDACEAGKVAHLDRAVLDAVVARRIPFTVFMGGRFARDNAEAVAALAQNPLVEIENHTWSHPSDMRRLSDAQIRDEVRRAEQQIFTDTGRHTHYFRFPGGNADARTVGVVEAMGYRVVHWRFPEGDPDPHVTAKAMIQVTLERAHGGDILIFHINGRGVHTAEAAPKVIDLLQALGFRFVRLSDYLDPSRPR